MECDENFKRKNHFTLLASMNFVQEHLRTGQIRSFDSLLLLDSQNILWVTRYSHDQWQFFVHETFDFTIIAKLFVSST